MRCPCAVNGRPRRLTRCGLRLHHCRHRRRSYIPGVAGGVFLRIASPMSTFSTGLEGFESLRHTFAQAPITDPLLGHRGHPGITFSLHHCGPVGHFLRGRITRAGE